MLEQLKKYLMFGAIAALLVAVIFGAGYFIVYKKIFKGKKKLSKKTMIVGAIFICYIMVVISATLLDRFTMWMDPNNINAMERSSLFSSYREAWNKFSFTEWRNLVLNIVLFIPFGFLLPMLSGKFEKFWKTYVMGLLLTVLIEVTQLITGRGVFEFDDILNNFVGTMIGFGLYEIVVYIVNKIKKRDTKVLSIALAQIPLLIVVISFIAVFTIYNTQEYGNLESNYSVKLSMKNIEIESDVNMSEEGSEKEIYKCEKLSREEAVKRAKKIFEQLGSKMDDSRTDYYDETVVCYGEDGNCVWLDYAGGTTHYNIFSKMFDENEERMESDTNADEKEIKKALEKIGVEIPKGSSFVQYDNGTYAFNAEQIVKGEIMYDGFLTCEYNSNHEIMSVDNEIVEYKKYKTVKLRSEKEAFEDITSGKFKQFKKPKNIHIKDVSIGYEMDSKAFYQPVYEFQVAYDGSDEVEDTIIISAIEK